MKLHATPLTIDEVKTYFPELLDQKNEYNYQIEFSAVKKVNSKLIAGVHITAIRYREQTFDGITMIMRELFPAGTECIKCYLRIDDNSPLKPMKSNNKQLIPTLKACVYSKYVHLLGLSSAFYNHPYARAMREYSASELPTQANV
jgi:hypothetical protein